MRWYWAGCSRSCRWKDDGAMATNLTVMKSCVLIYQGEFSGGNAPQQTMQLSDHGWRDFADQSLVHCESHTSRRQSYFAKHCRNCFQKHYRTMFITSI